MPSSNEKLHIFLHFLFRKLFFFSTLNKRFENNILSQTNTVSVLIDHMSFALFLFRVFERCFSFHAVGQKCFSQDTFEVAVKNCF